jgi:small conductance mechanosensitive channel
MLPGLLTVSVQKRQAFFSAVRATFSTRTSARVISRHDDRCGRATGNNEGDSPMQRAAYREHPLVILAMLLVVLCGFLSFPLSAQEPPGKAAESSKEPAPEEGDLSPAPAKVDVNPVARDDEIGARLQSVLEATGWFIDAQVRVEEGVVFLNGRTETRQLKEWAGDLSRNTQDVVAVANRIEVLEPSVWDFGPAFSGLMELWRDLIRSLPLIFFGLIVLALSVLAGVLVTRGARVFFRSRIRANLLRDVIARSIGVVAFLLGTYIVLKVSGLTQLALTVVGGTGLVGLAVGIAFRDITENFLASIFLSMQRPFETGDLVEITGVTGYVQQLNVRTTILMTLDGNLVQIPNASVYKNNLCNFTTNANRRADILVGIGYDDSIAEAQELARKVLEDHPAVLNDPEPSVLAESMGATTINLRIYFWLNGREHSWMKVRSSVIRLIKMAYQKQGISMPDEAREVVFPHGVPVTMVDRDSDALPPRLPESPPPAAEELDVASTKAEGGWCSEAAEIEEQARQAQPLKENQNLLEAEEDDTVPRAAP